MTQTRRIQNVHKQWLRRLGSNVVSTDIEYNIAEFFKAGI